MEISFQEDKWADNEELKNKFPRLFSLSTNRDFKLYQVKEWNNNNWLQKLEWRRNLFVWEKNQAHQLAQVLEDTSLNMEKDDKWVWKE